MDQIATELVTAALADIVTQDSNDNEPPHRLAFAGIGASTSGRGGADVQEMLADGFGRH